MQSLQASNLPAASLLLHSSRALASGTAASARIRKLESDLAVLRNSLEAYKQYICSQLASHEKDLQTCRESIVCGSEGFRQGKKPVYNRNCRFGRGFEWTVCADERMCSAGAGFGAGYAR